MQYAEPSDKDCLFVKICKWTIIVVTVLVLVDHLCFPSYGAVYKAYDLMNNSGGLNTKAAPFVLKDNESPDCQNVYFDTYGAIIKRQGYTKLNSTALNSGKNFDGLYHYRLKDGTSYLVSAAGALYKSDSLTTVVWEDVSVTNSITLTEDVLCDFETFDNELFITNGADIPYKWTGTTNAVTDAAVPTNLTKVKYVEDFKNYLFYANVYVDSTWYPSRIYRSNLKDPDTWTSTHFIDISPDDGQAITGLAVLGNRLVVFKENSIYNIYYTGDYYVPFYAEKTNSAVGCISDWSIQRIKNALIYLSLDGIYLFSGANSVKVSDKIQPTLDEYNANRFQYATSSVYRPLNQYWLTFSTSSSHNKVIVWDYFNNAFTVYDGIDAATLAVVEVSGVKRLYSGDYAGYCHRQNYGTTDNDVAIDSYYWTKWFDFGQLAYNKAIMHLNVFVKNVGDYNLNVGYTYDFDAGVWKSQNINMAEGGGVVGTAVVGTDVVGGRENIRRRLDLIGKGRVVRLRFRNAIADQDFTVYGFSMLVKTEGMR